MHPMQQDYLEDDSFGKCVDVIQPLNVVANDLFAPIAKRSGVDTCFLKGRADTASFPREAAPSSATINEYIIENASTPEKTS
jgi:hypothetical protein